MIDIVAQLAYFHFIRPWWLLLLPAAAILWWRVRRRAMVRTVPPAGIAPHLAAALTVGGGTLSRFLPIDGFVIGAVLMGLAAAGPTWSRTVNPLVAQTAPLAIALKVSQSMLASDVAPSRLERARQKILDVLGDRAGARTALIAYAGSAHRVAPLTEDPAVIKPFLEGLTPEVMPESGQNATAALALSRDALAGETISGAILFVLDTLDRADIPAFAQHAGEGGPPVVLFSVGGSDVEIEDLAGVPGASVVSLTPDGKDVDRIGRRIASAYRDALSRDDRQSWDDRGGILAWPAALIVLLWFRRGWTMRWAVAALAVFGSLSATPVRADGPIDWFLTSDQQGRLAFDDKNYAEAANLFEDPMWRGHAFYRAGKYEEAAEVFARLTSADAAYAQGMAHLKSRGYRPGVAAFETALERRPDYPEAARNLEIALAIVDYVERVREQSDTGEEGGMGADDVVFDNEAARGVQTTINAASDVAPQTVEQWMRTVDTRTADFLRTRFALESAKGDR